jgi:hypothetical protein
MQAARDRRGEVMTIFSPEARQKAQEARKAAVANCKFRRDWADSSSWDSLAQKHGIRLPQWHRPPTANALQKWHRMLDKEPFEDVYGCRPSRLIQLNPTMPLRAFIGQMLERHDSAAKGAA